jgi:hypothetical protein
VDGCDVSADMLASCRQTAGREGLSPKLYRQALHNLALPRKYQTIVVCGVFGIGGSRQQDFEVLQRFYDHLLPGGLLLLDNEVPYANKGLWGYWLEEERTALPKPWRELHDGDRRQGSDGAEYALRSRVVELDPLAQCVTIEMRAGLWRDGEHVATEEYVLRMSLYFTHEIAALLELTGFVDVTLRADYTDKEPGPDTDFVVFIARKPA